MKKWMLAGIFMCVLAFAFTACSSDGGGDQPELPAEEPQQEEASRELPGSEAADSPEEELPDEEDGGRIEEEQFDFFLVPQMNEEEQAYCDDYVQPLLYSGVLMREWSATDYEALALNWADEPGGMYLIMAFEDIIGSDEMQALWAEHGANLPGDEVEAVLTGRFAFTAEQVRDILAGVYKPESHIYQYEGGRGGGPIEAAVVGIRREDGLVYLDYVIYTGYSGLDQEPATYLYKEPGTLTLQGGEGDPLRYCAVELGEQEEAPQM